jgi:hypothetical protein
MCLLALALGCDTSSRSSREQLLEKKARLLDETAKILDAIDSPEQAEAAGPQLRSSWETYQELEAQLEALRDQPVSTEAAPPLKTLENTVKVNRKLVLARWKLVEKKQPYGAALLEPLSSFRAALKMEHGLPSDRTPVEEQALPADPHGEH